MFQSAKTQMLCAELAEATKQGYAIWQSKKII